MLRSNIEITWFESHSALEARRILAGGEAAAEPPETGGTCGALRQERRTKHRVSFNDLSCVLSGRECIASVPVVSAYAFTTG